MSLKRIFKNREIIAVLILAGFLRFYEIKQRFFWGLEQSLTLKPIVQLFEEKKLTLIGLHLFNYQSALFRPPFFIYLFALPLKLFKFDPFALEIIFSLLGILLIFFLYLAARKLFDKKTALLAAFLYASNSYLVSVDKNIWTITPIILTAALILFFLSRLSKKNLWNFFLIGCLSGLGFSFHFQAAAIFVPILILLICQKNWRQMAYFLAGNLLLLSPLILFNLRHQFIMVQGIKRLIFDQAVVVKQSSNFSGKLNNGLNSFTDLFTSILGVSFKNQLFINITCFVLFFLLPPLFIFKKTKSPKIKFLSLYFISSSLISLLGLIIIDQGFYQSTAFYIWLLTPLLLIFWAKILTILIKSNFIIGFLILGLYVLVNLSAFQSQSLGNYRKKLALVDLVFNQAKAKPFSLKFVHKDALAYDYLFYYRAPFYNLRFSEINLIEAWQSGQPDFILVHGDYDWEADNYSFKPYQKIIDCQGVKLVVK